MAEPTSNINIDNPTEVARETLRRLAMRRIAPTPDNYQTLYLEITGMPAAAPSTAPSAASVLAGLVSDLAEHHPALSRQLDSLGKAVEKEDWRQCSWKLSEISMQLKPQPAKSQRIETDDRGSEEDLVQLREMLAKTLEFGVASQLTHAPRLEEKAQQLAETFRAAHTPASLRAAASTLKSLWVSIDLQTADGRDQRDILQRILLLLVENIGELLEDDSWLRGQVDLVREVLTGPLRIDALQDAEKRLKDVLYKQSMVKHSLREATTTLKATMTTFVSSMREAVAANDDYQDTIATHIERIHNTEDVLELNRILESLQEATRTAQINSRRAHDQMVQQRDDAIRAEARIKQLETELAEMSALVREDPLTHSLNRRGLDEEFIREAARADRSDIPLCIAVLDIDNFKALNDTRGHQTGDDALIHLVKVAKDELRLTDHIARMGGEEFLILLPSTPIDEARRIITRLQRSLTKKYFLDNNEKVLITFSAGVAARAPGESQESAISRADAAMYQAKQTGKNRVCTAPDAPTEGIQ